MNREQLKAHLPALANKEIEPINPLFGLCRELDNGLITEGLIIECEDLMFQWSKFSGDYKSPVPHPTLSPNDAFYELDNLWDDDEYGNNRRELCRYIAENL